MRSVVYTSLVKQRIDESMPGNCQPWVHNSKAYADAIMQELRVNKESLLDNGQLQIRNLKVEINQQLIAKMNTVAKSIVWK